MMAASRPEPFYLALNALRSKLREGVLRPGDRITATEVADALKLSATPIGQTSEPAQEEDLAQFRRKREDQLLEQHRLRLVGAGLRVFVSLTFTDEFRTDGLAAGLVLNGADGDASEEMAGIEDFGARVDRADEGVLGDVFRDGTAEATAQKIDQPRAVLAVERSHSFGGIVFESRHKRRTAKVGANCGWTL